MVLTPQKLLGSNFAITEGSSEAFQESSIYVSYLCQADFFYLCYDPSHPEVVLSEVAQPYRQIS